MRDLSLTYVWDMPKMYSGNSFHSNNVQEKHAEFRKSELLNSDQINLTMTMTMIKIFQHIVQTLYDANLYFHLSELNCSDRMAGWCDRDNNASSAWAWAWLSLATYLRYVWNILDLCWVYTWDMPCRHGKVSILPQTRFLHNRNFHK